MSWAKAITIPLHRVQAGHGRRFVAEPRLAPEPVHRPARVSIMLALAHLIEDSITEGRVEDQAEAARRMGLTPARISQLLCLLRLAPDLQECLLFLQATDGIEPLTERELRPITQEREWVVQRRAFEEDFSDVLSRQPAFPNSDQCDSATRSQV